VIKNDFTSQYILQHALFLCFFHARGTKIINNSKIIDKE